MGRTPCDLIESDGAHYHITNIWTSSQNSITTWETIWLQYGEHNNCHSNSSIMRLSTRSSMQTFDILSWKGILRKLLENLMFWIFPQNMKYCNNLVRIKLEHWKHHKQWSNWITIRFFVIFWWMQSYYQVCRHWGNTPGTQIRQVKPRQPTRASQLWILLFCYLFWGWEQNNKITEFYYFVNFTHWKLAKNCKIHIFDAF